MKQIALLVVSFFAFATLAQAQTLDELKTQKAEKQAIKKGIDDEIAALDKAIKAFPGWTKGFSGLIGVNFAGSNDWYANAVETSNTSGVGITFAAFANNNQDKYFVKNDLLASVLTQKVTSTDRNDDTGVEGQETELSTVTSNFRLANLSGYKVSDKIAISAEGAYETGIIARDEDKGELIGIFNDPGQLTFSAGASWIPNNQTYVFVHPIGYQFNFPDGDFSSALGAKVGATYAGTLYRGIDWSSNLSAFLAYQEDADKNLSAGDLSNWTWLNTFTISNLFKGIGVGFTVGLRGNKQLAIAKGVTDGGGVQSYYSLGLSYAIGG